MVSTIPRKENFAWIIGTMLSLANDCILPCASLKLLLRRYLELQVDCRDGRWRDNTHQILSFYLFTIIISFSFFYFFIFSRNTKSRSSNFYPPQTGYFTLYQTSHSISVPSSKLTINRPPSNTFSFLTNATYKSLSNSSNIGVYVLEIQHPPSSVNFLTNIIQIHAIRPSPHVFLSIFA